MWRERETVTQLKPPDRQLTLKGVKKIQKNIKRGQIEKKQEGEDMEKVRERKRRECLYTLN